MDPWRVTPPRDRRDRRDRRNVIKFCWGQLQLTFEEQSLGLATLAQNCEPMVMSFGHPQELRAELPLSRHYKETLGRRFFFVWTDPVSIVCALRSRLRQLLWLYSEVGGWCGFSMFQLGDCENKQNKQEQKMTKKNRSFGGTTAARPGTEESKTGRKDRWKIEKT